MVMCNGHPEFGGNNRPPQQASFEGGLGSKTLHPTVCECDPTGWRLRLDFCLATVTIMSRPVDPGIQA